MEKNNEKDENTEKIVEALMRDPDFKRVDWNCRKGETQEIWECVEHLNRKQKGYLKEIMHFINDQVKNK